MRGQPALPCPRARARRPGRPTYKVDVYRAIVAAWKALPDVIVCASTSGRVFGEFEQRAEVLDLDGELKPGSRLVDARVAQFSEAGVRQRSR